MLPILFKAEGDCGTILWQFLGLSIPERTLVCFGIFILVALWIAFRRPLRAN